MAKKSDEVESSGLKMVISEGASNSISVIRRSSIPTPNTLALLEDPRSWHVRGEVGIQRKRHRRDDSNTEAMVAYPMAPPPPRDRAIPSRKVVLEEEEYVERLGDIIEGDYFPHNAKMSRALTRMAQNGATGVREGVTTPSGRSVIGTPSTLGSTTPASISFGDGSGAGASGVSIARGKGKGTPGTGGALTKFVATHTSEDNEAFAELQEKDQEAFRKRYFWAYEPANGEGASSAIPIKLLMMPNGKMMSAERRAEMDAACADRPKIGDHRPNQVETWKHRTRNQLMFSPNIAKSNDTCKIQEPLPLMIEEAEKRSSSNSKRRLISASEYYGKRQGKTKMTLLSEGEKPVSPGGGQGGVESGGEDLDTAASADSDSSTLKPDADADDDGRKSQEDALEESSLEGEERRDEVEREGIDKSEKEESTRSRHNGSPFESQSGCRSRRAASVVVKSNPKIIQAHATRFPMLPPPAPRPTGKWSSPIESPSSSRESVAELLAGGAKDKDSSGDYSEVPMTPSRVPGVDGDSPQITWGSIDGTPMILDPRATPLPDGSGIGAFDVRSFISGGGPRFEIKDLPEREKLAHRLEADDTRRKRAKFGITGAAAKATPTPSSTPCTPRTPGAGRTPGSTERPRSTRSRQSSASLTPAARTLALKLARKRSNATPFGGGLTPGRQTRRRENKRGTSGELATPTPNTPSSIVGKAGSGTPRVGGKGGSSSGGSEKKSSSLTDGLLAVK